MIYNVLTIAGTDPSGGAGISADLKTFSALGVYGTVVITTVVAQNTRGVNAVHQLSGEIVSQQLDTLFADVRTDAVKIRMLGDVPTAGRLRTQTHPPRPRHPAPPFR